MIPQQYNLFVLLTIFFFYSSSPAQYLIELKISGNTNFSDKDYTSWLKNKSDKNLDEVSAEIGEGLGANGFYHFEITKLKIDTTAKKNTTIIELSISEGEPTRIGSIVIDSLSSKDSVEILQHFDFLTGEILIKTELENRIENVLLDLENSGYPFASIKIKSIVFDSTYIANIYLGLSREAIRKIDIVEISGNSKTNDDVIINTTRLSKGELYSQSRIDEIPSLLNKLRFFENVSAPKYLVNSSGEGILQIDIVEKNTNLFDGILGYIPSSKDGESGYLTGFVNIGLRNLFGSGRGLSFKWKQESSATQELELKYLEPWILNQPFNLNFQFFQRKQDSSYVKRIIGGDLEFLATENISASIILESEAVIPSINSTLSINKSSSFNSGLQFKLDYRDDIYSPQKGTYFSSVYKFRTKNLEDSESLLNSITNSSLEYHQYELDFGIFYSPFLNQVIALGVHAKEIIGDYYDVSDFFQFGGTNSLRGYRENQFMGNRLIWSNLEYRFLLSQTSYVFAFYDAGYYLINENIINNINRQSDLKNGYGFGISLETGLGIMRVSYAFSEGSSLTNGLIHFGLFNDF